MALYQRTAAKWSGRGRLHAAEPAVRDWLLALASAGLSLASLAGKVSQLPVTDDEIVPFAEADGLGFALVLIGTIPLAWRRRAPLPLLAITTISAFLVEWLGYPPPPLPFAVLVALFTVAQVSSYRVTAAATAVVAASVAVAAIGASGTFTDDKFLAYLLSIGATAVAGYGLQLSRDRAAQAEQLADLLRKAEVAQTLLAVERERERIVRELHDLVSNSVCVIIAQAGAARRRFGTEPEPVREVLASVETAGRQALAELRQLLRVLSTEDPAAEPMPQPGLGDLPSLLSQLERAGLPVTLTVRGEARSLPAQVELAAYRIVQEALTNSLKHAGPAHAEVQLGYSGETLELRVSDDGWGSVGEVVAGRGMAGMRERTSLLGGRLTIGPGEVSGFRITATLPAEEGQLWAPAS